MNKIWVTSRREITIDRTLVMGILNITPDSFSDGGQISSLDDALHQAEKFAADGAHILDVGGESTRPGSSRVSIEEEIRRVVPVIEELAKRFHVPVSVDTSKSEVAAAALDAGAEIINDISAFRFDERVGEIVTQHRAGLVLMHSRGEFDAMHSQPPVADIMSEVSDGFRESIEKAVGYGVHHEQIALDVGIGFGKSFGQNLELVAKLDKLVAEFPRYPMLVGTSRKSFIGKILDGAPVESRLCGSLATAAVAVWNGANIVRVHDVQETIEVVRVIDALKDQL